MSLFDVGTFRIAEEQMIGVTQIHFPYEGFGMSLPIKSILLPAVVCKWAILFPEPISLSMLCVLKHSKRIGGSPRKEMMLWHNTEIIIHILQNNVYHYRQNCIWTMEIWLLGTESDNVGPLTNTVVNLWQQCMCCTFTMSQISIFC